MATSLETLRSNLSEALRTGCADEAASFARQALEAGEDPLDLIQNVLVPTLTAVGQDFQAFRIFLPELMAAGEAAKAAMAELEPALKARYASDPTLSQHGGTVVIATVQTDIHDIGKNMVSSMLTASGFTVYDLGVDVPIKTILAKAQEVNADIIACSALLTTSLPVMRDLLRLLEASGERPRFKVMVGGAAVTPAFAREIGADGTAENALAAVELARRLMQEKQ